MKEASKMIFLLLIFGVLAIPLAASACFSSSHYEDETAGLAAFSDGTYLRGQLFGSGTETFYFTYIKVLPDGGLVMGRTEDFTRVTIYEEDRADGTMEIIYARGFGVDSYVFHVPKGTVMRNFEVDLQ